jgi:cell division septum initiation protein DivIVA
MSAASGDKNKAGNSGNGANGRRPKQTPKSDTEFQRIAGDEADRIVAEAYKEAARIMEEAKQRAKYISGETDNDDTGVSLPADALGTLEDTREIYEQVDDLFVQIRQQLGELNNQNRMVTDQLLDRVNRLEYYVDTLVVDSLKLRNVRHWLQGTTTLARRLRARLDR